MLNQIDLSRVDLNLFVVFEAVLAERHVGRAADRLHISASAVSHSLSRLRRVLNDPLFIRTPKGVVPTDRAIELASVIDDVLARARSVIATAEPFDPKTSTRRFTLGAPDGVSAVFLPRLLTQLDLEAPNIDIAVRQLLPTHKETAPDRIWRNAFVDLETRTIDLAVIPSDEIPARFHYQLLYEESFVLAMRNGHPLAGPISIDQYCKMRHLVVSLNGDPYGHIDHALKELNLSRRVSVTAPNFMFALALLSESDFVAALPRSFAEMYKERFDIQFVEAPVPLGIFRLNAVAPRSGMMDAGVAWLLDRLLLSNNQA